MLQRQLCSTGRSDGAQSLGKYRVSRANEPLEKEADRVAGEIVRLPDSAGFNGAADVPLLQRKCAACNAEGAPCPLCSLSVVPVPMSRSREQLQSQPIEEEDDDRMLQRQPRAAATPVANGSSKVVEAIRSGGERLSDTARSYFEPRFGADLRGVRVHTGESAALATSAVNARAFALGNSIAFGPGQFDTTSSRGRRLLAHELTHVLQQQGQKIQCSDANESPVPAVPATLSLDLPANVRTLQAHLNLAGAGIDVTGVFDGATSKALEDWQRSNALTPSGVVDHATLDVVLAEMVATNQHDFAIPLVADAEDLDQSDVLALRTAWTWDSSWSESVDGGIHIAWEGRLRELWVAVPAFGSHASLVAAVRRGLSVAPPPETARPIKSILTPTAELNAIEQVGSRLADPVAIAALRGIIGATAGSKIDPELVHRLAEMQPLGVANGQLDDATLDLIVAQHRKGRENSVLRLVMDAFDLGSNALVSIMFDDKNLGGFQEAMTDEFGPKPEVGANPSILYVGPRAFRNLSALLQTLMHELVHVDLSSRGIEQGAPGTSARALHEFLGEAAELLAAPALDAIETVIQDGGRALTNWLRMDRPDRVEHWSMFEDVRKVVLDAFPNIPTTHNSHYRAEKIKKDYEAVKKPPD